MFTSCVTESKQAVILNLLHVLVAYAVNYCNNVNDFTVKPNKYRYTWRIECKMAWKVEKFRLLA